MLFGSDGAGWTNEFALVAYIPEPLGSFLDEFRRRLQPGSRPHAHVTLLPPRPVSDPAQAWRQIASCASRLPLFEAQATEVQVFEATEVVYLEIGLGRETLVEIHAALNQDALAAIEGYPYYPHITLAQDLVPAEVAGIAGRARRIWAECECRRTFSVEALTFVQNTTCLEWTDLNAAQLVRQPLPVVR
ncbi:MAG: 2'-5' RNA ligase family protein [Acidobacteria bacterium]|nr:2'-5' RNA ligase family protein [Acidobacteriota bacterium]